MYFFSKKYLEKIWKNSKILRKISKFFFMIRAEMHFVAFLRLFGAVIMSLTWIKKPLSTPLNLSLKTRKLLKNKKFFLIFDWKIYFYQLKFTQGHCIGRNLLNSSLKVIYSKKSSQICKKMKILSNSKKFFLIWFITTKCWPGEN